MNCRSGALNIVIVEDNPGDAVLIEGLLQDLGRPTCITLAKDGRDALMLLTKASASGPPDLVILDLNLPRFNGYEVLSVMRTDPALKKVPVVVMTGSLNPEDEVRSRRMGAIDYCIKPATLDEMDRTMVCLRNHMEMASHGREDGSPGPPSDSAPSRPTSPDRSPFP